MKKLLLVSAVLTLSSIAVAGPVALEHVNLPLRTRFIRATPTINDRPGCRPGATVPPNRVNTTQRLADLRSHFAANNIHAYIITSDNAHQVLIF